MRTGIFQISQEGSAPSLAAHLSWGWYNLGGTRELTSLHVCTAARMKRVKQCEAKADTKVRPRSTKRTKRTQQSTLDEERRRTRADTLRGLSARRSRSLGVSAIGVFVVFAALIVFKNITKTHCPLFLHIPDPTHRKSHISHPTSHIPPPPTPGRVVCVLLYLYFRY